MTQDARQPRSDVLDNRPGGRDERGMKATLAASLLLLSAGLAQAQQHKTYAVRGQSAAELIAQMRALGPHGYWAWTAARYDWRYDYSRGGGQCRIRSATVTETITMTLPVWSNQGEGRACLQAGWDRMLARLTEHEQGHVSRWAGTRDRIHAILLATPPQASCDAVSKAANEAANAEIRNTQAFQDEYDRQTNHGIASGVALREC